MALERFSLFIKHSKIKEFVDYLEQGKIMATKCRTCGTRYYPPKADCPSCMDSKMEWTELSCEGQLVTFTRVFVLPERYTSSPSTMPFTQTIVKPAAIGIIEVENGVRIMGFIPNVNSGEIRVGMLLRAVPHILANGKITIALYPSQNRQKS